MTTIQLMKNRFLLLTGTVMTLLLTHAQDENNLRPIFADSLAAELKDGWSWVRENPDGWRLTPAGLEVQIEPGNMWGGANNAKNVLIRRIPDPSNIQLTISVTVRNRPTEQYEQVNLVWYYDDSNMVKIGQEQVDGQLSVVMGREENDRTRTMAIIPIQSDTIDIQFVVTNDNILGQFRPHGSAEWKTAGTTDLPGTGPAYISLQTYQGPAHTARWALFKNLQIQKGSE